MFFLTLNEQKQVDQERGSCRRRNVGGLLEPHDPEKISQLRDLDSKSFCSWRPPAFGGCHSSTAGQEFGGTSCATERCSFCVQFLTY